MFRYALPLFFWFAAVTASAQVQSVGDVSFAVPDGWTYKPGTDFGAVVVTSGQNYWLMAVYKPMPSSGDPTTDLKAAWTRIVLAGHDYQGFPPLPYYDINHSVGYRGRRADDSSTNHATYTRLYVLEAGKSFIPVVAVSPNGQVLNAMEHVATGFIGSVRVAPLQAQPLKTTITVADLVGHCNHGAASSYDFYNRQTGRYESNASAFYGAGYTIAADGSFTYEMAGMTNGRTVRDQESGVVELSGGLIIFKGRSHVLRYRFINCQQALDGSTVLTLLAENSEVTALTILRDGDQWTRPAPRK
ncbi:MAG: hypothetical protein ABSG54_09385 [Terriglobia bacterium]|jgi:hypothetical protein